MTSENMCPKCRKPLDSQAHYAACDIIEKIHKWAEEGTLMEHCSVKSPETTPHLYE